MSATDVLTVAALMLTVEPSTFGLAYSKGPKTWSALWQTSSPAPYPAGMLAPVHPPVGEHSCMPTDRSPMPHSPVVGCAGQVQLLGTVTVTLTVSPQTGTGMEATPRLWLDVRDTTDPTL